MTMALAAPGRVALAQAIFAQPLALALGAGDGAWTQPANVVGDETGLLSPFALVRAAAKTFVSLVDADDLDPAIVETLGPEMNQAGLMRDNLSNIWQASDVPTRYVYALFIVAQATRVSDTTRERGVYGSPTIAGTIPPGQLYVPWVSVTSPGTLITIEHIAPLAPLGEREAIGVVLTF